MRTEFVAEIDGFAFDNTWTDIEPADLDQLAGEVSAIVAAASLSPALMPFAVLIPPGPPISNAILAGIVNGLIKDAKVATFGLCGGMACAALDYFNLRWVPPRGTGPSDHPTFRTPSGAELRRYIWSRLLDTLRSDGLTCLLWMATGHQIFPFSGGWPELLRRTRDDEWAKIKARLDTRTPWPVGVIGTTDNPMNNHQILATGYEDAGDGRPVLFAYDSNFPGVETQLQLDFTGTELVVTHSGGDSPNQGPIKGLYCESYTQRTPPATLVVESGVAASAESAPVGGALRVTYSARNVGFGPTPALRLFGVGRMAADGRNVDAGHAEGPAEPIQEGAGRDYDRTVTLAEPLGLRRYVGGLSVEAGVAPALRHAWRTLPVGPAARAAADVTVTAPASAWATFGGHFIAPPAAGTNGDGRIIVAGVGLDGWLYRLEQTAPANGWGGRIPTSAGGPRLAGRPAITRNVDGRVEIFMRGEDGEIRHSWQTAPGGAEWSGWAGLGDRFAGDPDACANQDGRIEVFAVAPDGRLRHKWQFPFGWNGWADLLHGCAGRPSAGRHPDGRLEVFCRTADGGIAHAWQRTAGGDWDQGDFGGRALGDPVVAANSDGRLEVFAQGADGALWHRWITSSGWSQWVSLGGAFPAGAVPAAVLNGRGGLEVFVRGTDGAVHHTWQVPSPPYWSAWAPLDGGTVAADPVAVPNADGRIELIALGIDNTAVHRWQTGSGWNG